MAALDSFSPQGFLARCLQRAARATDAPREFHIFASLAALGAAASRVRIPYVGRLVPPALWVVLVAPTAFYRKTTAMHTARSLLAAARPALAPPPVYRSRQLLRALHSAGKLLVVEDFSTLLPLPVAERLVELDDSRAPLTLLAAASSHAFAARLVATDFSAGLLSRFLFIVPRPTVKDWLSEPAMPCPEEDAALAAFLAAAARLDCTASFDACKAEHRAWGQDAVAFIQRFSESRQSVLAAGVAARLQLALFKLAALLELARHSTPDELEAAARGGALAVTRESFHSAAQLAGYLRDSFGRLLESELRRASALNEDLRVLTMLRRRPGITRRQLLQNIHLPAATLDSTLARLKSNGTVRSDGMDLYLGSSSRRSDKATRANGEFIENKGTSP